MILVFVLDLSEMVDTILIFVFSITVSVSYVQIMHHKMMEKDYNYKISVNDERNEKIRDKVMSAMTSALTLLMGIITVVHLAINADVSADFLAVSLWWTPLIMFFIRKCYEKKY